MILISSLLLTGCLEEILASLCESLTSSNTIVASLMTSDPSSYSNLKVVVTYRNETNFTDTMFTGETDYTISDCDNAFSFPSGERKMVQGSGPANSISMIKVLDSQGEAFFTKDGDLNVSDVFSVNAELFSNCDDEGPVGVPVATFQTQMNKELEWNGGAGGIPTEFPGIGECTITGETAVVQLDEQL